MQIELRIICGRMWGSGDFEAFVAKTIEISISMAKTLLLGSIPQTHRQLL
jgi:hypothetical protein